MRNLKKIIFLVLSIFSLIFLSFETFAATKAIKSVKIYANSNLEVGDNLENVNISLENSEDDINIYLSDESKYSIESASIVTRSNKILKLGDEVKIKLVLRAKEGEDTIYKFNSSYSKANVNIVGGEYISTSKSNGNLIITFKLKAIKGRYDAPNSVVFTSKIGKATWEAPKNTSSYYDILVYKGENQIANIKDYKGTSINLYPYMISKGRYYFKVRTVAHTDEQKKYAANSEYERSDDIYIEADEVSDGSGKYEDISESFPNIEVIKKAGWIKENSFWYYRFPDGSYKKNAWELINDKWYFFDNSGKMLTGWQKINNKYYYLDKDNGDMKTSWINENGEWYYLSEDSLTLGAMLTNTWLYSLDNKVYYLTANGNMAKYWTNIGDNWYYFYEDGHLAMNEIIDTFRVNEKGVWVK